MVPLFLWGKDILISYQTNDDLSFAGMEMSLFVECRIYFIIIFDFTLVRLYAVQNIYKDICVKRTENLTKTEKNKLMSVYFLLKL